MSVSMKKNSIKRYCLSVLLIGIMMILSINSAISADYISSKLSEIEKTYYGYTLSGTTESRLSRLEKSIYGATSTKPQKTRIDKLCKDLNVGVKVAQGQYTGAASPVDEDSTQQKNYEDIGPKADAGIKYPIVDALEQKTFKKAYVNDDIYVRLSRLEKQVFPNSQKKSTQSLNERVDALRSKILGGTQNDVASVEIDPKTEEIVLENGQKYYGDFDPSNFNSNPNSHYNYYSYENSKNMISKNKADLTENNDDYLQKYNDYAQNYDLDVLEKDVFGKRYTNESSCKRLARLESQVFQRTFSDNDDARIQRLLAVTTAQKTSQEYDSNKWARRLNTGMQIGSILLMVLAMIL